MYELYFLTSAEKEFKKLEIVVQKKLKDKLKILCTNPDILKTNIKVLKGEYQGKFRLRVGKYRIIFKIEDEQLIIVIVSIGHRKDIY
jgi:mRNA interferase RelE/StbE